ncbi:hypothetical protein Goshw_019639 [Gossypium schwendimanii]|uniref:Uncharacterized protein n=1 Tax=Gossypium schwendimanii TaxID=34291 RepID=A0A7J9NB85_GOSSC|nr:hypothetical protein [Gossypium schwendimanii]
MISIFKVHQARFRGDKIDVVVEVSPVQHSGIQDLMMTEIHNLQAFAQKLTDVRPKEKKPFGFSFFRRGPRQNPTVFEASLVRGKGLAIVVVVVVVNDDEEPRLFHFGETMAGADLRRHAC